MISDFQKKVRKPFNKASRTFILSLHFHFRSLSIIHSGFICINCLFSSDTQYPYSVEYRTPCCQKAAARRCIFCKKSGTSLSHQLLFVDHQLKLQAQLFGSHITEAFHHDFRFLTQINLGKGQVFPPSSIWDGLIMSSTNAISRCVST